MTVLLAGRNPYKTFHVVDDKVVQNLDYTTELSNALRSYATSNSLVYTSQSAAPRLQLDDVQFRLPEP